MTTHTPGPWTTRPAFASRPTLHVTDGKGSHLASFSGPNYEANARLVAAAPELLAALEQIAYSDFSAEVCKAKAKFAIARAKGQA